MLVKVKTITLNYDLAAFNSDDQYLQLITKSLTEM